MLILYDIKYYKGVCFENIPFNDFLLLIFFFLNILLL